MPNHDIAVMELQSQHEESMRALEECARLLGVDAPERSDPLDTDDGLQDALESVYQEFFSKTEKVYRQKVRIAVANI